MNLNFKNILKVYENFPNVSLHLSNTPQRIVARVSPKSIYARCVPHDGGPSSLVPLYKINRTAALRPKSKFSIGTGTIFPIYSTEVATINGVCFSNASPNVALEKDANVVRVLRNDRASSSESIAGDLVDSIDAMVTYHNGVAECAYQMMYCHCIEIISDTVDDLDLFKERVKGAIRNLNGRFVHVSKTRNHFMVTVFDPIGSKCEHLDVDTNRLKLTVNAHNVNKNIVFHNNGGMLASELYSNYCKRVGIEYDESQIVYDVLKFFSDETEGKWYSMHEKEKPAIS